MRATCLACGSDAGDSVSGKGICPNCKATRPEFIPRNVYEGRDTITPGYVVTSRGLVRYDRSTTAAMAGDAPTRTWQIPIEALEPNRKRTPQERLDSLTSRLASTFANGVIPQSMLEEVQREGIARGNHVSMDQLRALASFYLNRAARA